MNIAETYLGEKVLEQGLRYILHEPEKKLPLILNWAEKIATDPNHKQNIKNLKKVLEDENSNWYKFAQKLLTKTHPKVKERLAVNFFINSSLIGVPKQKQVSKKIGASVPWAILIDPTEKCNLNCLGCWAGDYQKAKELDYETMDRVLSEAEELGIYFIVVSGGEPLVRKKDLIELAEKHKDQVFHIFTNGTLIDEKFVSEMGRLGNIVVALSIEGFEKTTDFRRGEGVFKKVLHAMELMRDSGMVYGFSATYARNNTEELASEEFIDLMIEKGATFGWFFTYIPIGKDVDMEMMATPEQRAYMFERIKHFRQTKPIFLVDFWNDGEASNGCIAGGRRYFHINAAGDVEPCAFVHYSTCNIKNVSLVEALKNPLFKAYQKRQPFDENLRRPCPIIDHPEKLLEMVKESGAESTQLHDDETIDEFAEKMKKYASSWGSIAEKIWYD
ncbi:MAG: hypothetical protein PWQ82_1137 [Thermosediminibacterales bacterium]|nr:hypothetical protein [Thermosediminibacterales bacterium]MDK2835669.1 hypothetical protein [Thermosediminibacterales bacterium]